MTFTNVGEVTLPDSVETLAEDAFSNCTWLETVTLPKGLKTIGTRAFGWCPALKTISFPEGLEIIGVEAFRECTALETVTLLKGLKEISSSAFTKCGALKTLTLPEGLEDIGESAFKYCELLETVVLPEGLKYLGGSAFSECLTLNSVTLPKSLKSIGGSAFSYCSALKYITFAEGLEVINGYAFSHCYALDSVTFPKSLKSIGENVFINCRNLVATFKGGMPDIGKNAFVYSNHLAIDGGSIASVNEIMRPRRAPTNSAGQPVYLSTLTFQLSDNMNATFFPIVELVDTAGNKISYGLDLVTTDDKGKAYLWLPEGTTISQVIMGTGIGEQTRKFTPRFNMPLTVAANNNNEAVFTAEQVSLNVEMRGPSSPDLMPTFVDYNGNPITSAAKGQRIGLNVTQLESRGLRVVGLYRGSSAYGGGLQPGTPVIESVFKKGSVNYQTVYWFNVEDSDTLIHCVVAKANDPAPSFEPEILTDALPSTVQGDLYGYVVSAQGPEGTKASVSGLPEGLASDGLNIYGVPQQAGTFEVTVTLEPPTGDPLVKKFALVVAPNDPRTLNDQKGNNVTGFVPSEAKLVVEDAPFGIDNMQRVSEALDWRDVASDTQDNFRMTDSTGTPYRLVSLMANETHLALNGEKLSIGGSIDVGFRLPGFEFPDWIGSRTEVSFVGIHVQDGGGVQIVEGETIELREVEGYLEEGMKLVEVAGGMSGELRYVDSNEPEMRFVDSAGTSPFALFLKVKDTTSGSTSASDTLASTGDATPWVPIAVCAIASGALLVGVALRRKRTK